MPKNMENNGAGNRTDVVVPLESIRAISERFVNTTYGFLFRKRVAYPIVANYVRNIWGKYGLVKSMLNSSTRSSYARAMIELQANVEFKDTIMVAMPKLVGEGFYTCTIHVKANYDGPSLFNVGSSSTTTTPIVDKKDKLERLIIDGKITIADDEGKPLEKVDYSGDHDSEDKVEPVDNEMASFYLQRGLVMVLIVCWNNVWKLIGILITTTTLTMMICMKAKKFLTTFNLYAISWISRYEVVRRNRLLEIIDSSVV
ncbi:hypothetical protein Tco_0904766 [Tanacetum coccineum]